MELIRNVPTSRKRLSSPEANSWRPQFHPAQAPDNPCQQVDVVGRRKIRTLPKPCETRPEDYGMACRGYPCPDCCCKVGGGHGQEKEPPEGSPKESQSLFCRPVSSSATCTTICNRFAAEMSCSNVPPHAIQYPAGIFTCS